MAHTLDKLVIIDLESTCWDKSPDQHPPAAGGPPESEIIEIGICVVDLSSWTVGVQEGMLVSTLNSTISEFCTSLTTITQEMVDESGIAFNEACRRLREKYNTNNRVWGSWGDYDRRQFERQCKRPEFRDSRYPFGPTHINIKNLFAITQGLSREVGMDKALEILGMPLEGTHHRGIDDAYNIARIACHLFKSF